MGSLFSTLGQIFLLTILGYVLRRKDVIDKDGVALLSKLVINVLFPCSLIASGHEVFHAEMGRSLLVATLVIFGYYAISLLVSLLVFRPGHTQHGGENVAMIVFANIGFIGIPLVLVIYGGQGVIYGIIYNLLYNLFFFSIGYRFLNPHAEKLSVKRLLTDKLTLLSVVSILLYLCPYKLPSFIQGALSMMGNATAPFSMIIVGCWMVGVDWKKLFGNAESYLIAFFRLLLSPFLVYLVLRALHADPVMMGSIVLITAMPIGTMVLIFRQKATDDVSYVNGTLLLSLVLCVVTVPLMMMLVGTP